MAANRPTGFELWGERAGFVAADSSWCGELITAGRHSAATGAVVVVSSADALREGRQLRAVTGARTVIDSYAWHRQWASVDVPTALHAAEDTVMTAEDMLLPYSPADWARDALAYAGAEAVYLPSFTVRAGEPEVLAAQVDAALRFREYGITPFLALEAEALDSRHIEATLAALDPAAGVHLTLQFNGSDAFALATEQRIGGLREVLGRFPGSDITGLDVAGGLDALAHGARWVGIGAASSRRFPRVPGARGGGSGDSAGFKPGTWLRYLMDMHSPDVYADWHANTVSPRCDVCGRALDLFGASPEEKTAAIAHNLHGIRDVVAELFAQPQIDRPSWLNDERVAAFEAHAQLVSVAGPIQADLMLRRLIELDDPAGRSTAPGGVWKTV